MIPDLGVDYDPQSNHRKWLPACKYISYNHVFAKVSVDFRKWQTCRDTKQWGEQQFLLCCCPCCCWIGCLRVGEVEGVTAGPTVHFSAGWRKDGSSSPLLPHTRTHTHTHPNSGSISLCSSDLNVVTQSSVCHFWNIAAVCWGLCCSTRVTHDMKSKTGNRVFPCVFIKI